MPREVREELQRLRTEVEALRVERESLETRLEEARTTLTAIRNGEVDAFVVSPPRTTEHISTLQEVEFPYRKLVETMNEGALTLLEDGTILFCNGRFADMLGVPRERLIEAQIRSLVPPAGRPGLDAVLRSGVAGNARGETRFLGATGSVVPAHLSVSPLEIGDWRCLCVVATDLTDQKKTEEILAAEKLARLILDQAAEAIVVTNESGRVLRANESAIEICGSNPLLRDFRAAYPVRLTVRGLQTIDGMGPRKGEPAFPLVPDLRGRSFRGIETELMEGQERRFFLLSAGPLLARGDKLLGFVATLTDITERKKAEESLLRTNADLEARVELRTQELRASNETLRQEISERQHAEDELALRVEELRRSNAELERFAYVSSHDLQEPLRTITSFTQLLARRLEGRLDPEAGQYVGYIVDGAKRMHDLLQDLLVFLRLRTEGLGVGEASTQECLRLAIQNLGKAIQESGARVVAAQLPTVRADPKRIVQVFQNLVGNAIKYRGEEPPVVEVTARRIGTDWEFSVKDNGIGIDHPYHERVFEIFQRLHTREEYSGTGIGLAICKQIVEQHGGRIWVESEPGRGSIFRFSLPEEVPAEATAG